MTETEAIADVVLSRRKQLRKSQIELSHDCGLDRTYVSLLERGLRNPQLTTLLKLCVGLELTFPQLAKRVQDRLG